MNHFYLIGYMGAGKSSVAREMSSMLNLNVFEMDDILEARFGKSIAEIFSTEGAEVFRNAETELLKEITFDPTIGSRMTDVYQEAMGIEKANPFIVSCGGGVPLRAENVEIMKDNGVVIWLSAEAETIAERLSGANDRPLLPGDKDVDSIREMLQLRTPYYQSAADFTVVTDDKTIQEVALAVVKELVERMQESPEERSLNSEPQAEEQEEPEYGSYSEEGADSEGMEDYTDDYEEMLEDEE